MLLCRVCCLLYLGLLFIAWVVFACELVVAIIVSLACGVGWYAAGVLLIVLV